MRANNNLLVNVLNELVLLRRTLVKTSGYVSQNTFNLHPESMDSESATESRLQFDGFPEMNALVQAQSSCNASDFESPPSSP